MTTRIHRLELEATYAIILAVFVGVFLAMYSSNHRPKFNMFLSIPISQENQTPMISPLSINPLPKSQIISQISPDGTKKVIMETVYNKDNMQTYIFSTADSSGANKQVIFETTLDETKTMTIPFNTFSPDNKYFFIQEQTKDGNITDVKAFKTSGELLNNGEKYFDVTDLFRERNTGNNFNQATGWASETLIIINTTTKDNTKGPSYWFEIPSKAIIQLATEF